MRVDANINLSSDDSRELARVLKCPENELETKLSEYASAALREYTAMFLGQKVFTRGSDIREYRLFLLIQSAFGKQIPDESDVCRLFQCTTTEARSLIRSVMSKYQSQVHPAVEDSIRAVLLQAKVAKKDGPRLVTINNATIVEFLNMTLSSIDGKLPQVAKHRGTVSTYEIQESSYQRLSDNFSVLRGKIK